MKAQPIAKRLCYKSTQGLVPVAKIKPGHPDYADCMLALEKLITSWGQVPEFELVPAESVALLDETALK